MANRNFPGSGPIDRDLDNMRNNPDAASTPFGGLDGALSDLTKSLDKGNIGGARSSLASLNREAKEANNDILSLNKIRATQIQQEIKQNQIEIRDKGNFLNLLKKQLVLETSSGKLNTDRIKVLRDGMKIAKEDQLGFQARNSSLRTSLDLQRRNRDEQNIAYREYTNNAKVLENQLHRVSKAQHSSFGSHLVQSRFNPIKAAQRYGYDKMAENMPESMGGAGEGSIGGMAGGAVAAAGGAILAKLIDISMGAIIRNLQNSFTLGDVWKGAGSGTSLSGFKGNIHETLAGYGTSADDEANLAKMIRPIVGAVGNYDEILRQGVAQDRAMGSDTGSNSQFLATMIRKGGLSSQPSDMGKFGNELAEALGRSQLTGLQEEMLHGITQLVDLTRTSASTVVHPAMFANLIADVSSIGNKNMRGTDAAGVIAGFNQTLQAPNSQFSQLMGMSAIRSVVEGMVREGKVDKSRLEAGNLLFTQSQGLAAEVPLLAGGSAAIGDKIMKAMIDQSLSVAGTGALGDLSLAKAANITPAQARSLRDNSQFLDSEPGKKFSKDFGIEGFDKFNTGTSAFLGELSSIYGAQTRHGANPVTEAQKNIYVDEAMARFGEKLTDTQDKDKYNALLPQLTGKDANSKLQQIMEFASNIKTGAPTDKLRSDIEDIKKVTQKMADAVVDKIAPGLVSIVHFLMPGPRDEAAIKAATNRAKAEGIIPDRHKDSVLSPTAEKLERMKDKAKADGILLGHPRPQFYTNYASDLSTGKEDIDANKKYIEESARAAGVDPKAIKFIAGQETGGGYNNFNKDGSVLTNKESGAMGIMQLMPDTAKMYGVNPKDTHSVIDAGVKEFKKDLIKYNGDVGKALIDYDGGGIHLKNGTPLKPETIKYLLAAQRAGVLPDDYVIPNLNSTGATNSPSVPQTTGEQNTTMHRIGIDSNVNVTHSDQNGRPVAQGSNTYSTQIDLGQNKNSATSYKQTVNMQGNGVY